MTWLKTYREQDFFILYPGNDSWNPLMSAFADGSDGAIRKVERVASDFDPEIFAATKAKDPLPPEFTLVRMDAILMQHLQTRLTLSFGAVWTSAAYFQSNGIGFCMLKEGRITNLCYSVFFSGRHHEIDISTLPGLGGARVLINKFFFGVELKSAGHPGMGKG